MSVEQIKNSANIKRRTVTIDSDIGVTGPVNNFIYDLSTTISDVRLIEVTDVEFNLDAYNVNDYQNNITLVDTLGVTHSIEIVKKKK